jgi:hypothetical protein
MRLAEEGLGEVTRRLAAEGSGSESEVGSRGVGDLIGGVEGGTSR